MLDTRPSEDTIEVIVFLESFVFSVLNLVFVYLFSAIRTCRFLVNVLVVVQPAFGALFVEEVLAVSTSEHLELARGLVVTEADGAVALLGQLH